MYKLTEQEQQVLREIKRKTHFDKLTNLTNYDFDFEKPFNVYKVDLNKRVNIALLKELSGDENINCYNYNIVIFATEPVLNGRYRTSYFELKSNNHVICNYGRYYDYMLKNNNKTIRFYIFMQSKKYDRKYARKNKNIDNSYYSDRYLIKNNYVYNRFTGKQENYLDISDMDKSGYNISSYEYQHKANLDRMRKIARVNNFYKNTKQAQIDAFYNKIKDTYNTYKIKFIGLLMDDKNDINEIRNGLGYVNDLKDLMKSFKNAMDNKTLNYNYMNEYRITDITKWADYHINEIESRK